MILHNSIQTPDGTVLISTHQHDFCAHTDDNGKYYFVDGGTEYLRRSANGDEVDLSVTTDSPHELIREVVKWTSNLDVDGNPLPKPITRRLSELTTEHVQAIIDTQGLSTTSTAIFNTELQWRYDHDSN